MSSFFKFYTNALQKSPRLTNAVSTGLLFGLGDAVAQIGFSSSKIDTTTGKETVHIGTPYDPYRTLRAAIYGGIIFAPIGDKWYKFLQNKVGNPTKYSNLTNTIMRVSVDQLVFAPIAIPFYFFTISKMEGKSTQDAVLKVKENYQTTLLANWAVWPVFQMFNFYLVPVHHRLLSVNMISIFWNTYLSYRNSLYE